MQSRSQLAGLIEPTLGGALYGACPALPFLADGAPYAVSFGLVFALRAGTGAGWAGGRGGPTAGRVTTPARRALGLPTGPVTCGAGRRRLRQHTFLLPAGLWVALLTAAFLLAPAVSASLFGTLSGECPDALVGLAQASLTLVVGVAAPVAPVVTGLVVDRWSAVAAIGVIAVVFAMLAVAAFAIPAFRVNRTD